jgi:predicted nucleotidyltransferase
MSHHDNIVRLKGVHNLLTQTGVNFAFVGGATVSLYAQRETEEVRPTDDVDVVVEIAAYNADFAKLTEQLLNLGFNPDAESRVICRYLYKGLIVDIMPIGEDVFGFVNRWYKSGLNNAEDYRIDDQTTVSIFTAPYFIASKLEAFNDRGENDGRTSRDFEDIIFVMENRHELWEELNAVDAEVRDYLKEEFNTLLNTPYIEEWIDCHAGYSSPPMTPIILEEMRRFSSGD